MSLNHISIAIPASKVEPLVTFLVASLAHLGWKEHVRYAPYVVGLGEERHADFWIAGILPEDVDEKTVETMLKSQHIAFTAQSAEQVQQFHVAALKAGGKDNGAPGPRPQYTPGYYAAFVRDPVFGINIEAVCHNGAAA
ncbi:MAG: hypothetical protein Q9182_004823 [Xanthomendoza sp. 2 TL-2023]